MPDPEYDEEKSLYGSMAGEQIYLIPKPELTSITPNSKLIDTVANAILGGTFRETGVEFFPTSFVVKSLYGIMVEDIDPPATSTAMIDRYTESVDLYGVNASVAMTAWAESV